MGGSTESPCLQAETPEAAAAEAGERRTDVYMGIDVFGRGTYGGGGLNTHVAAAAAIREGASFKQLTFSCTLPSKCSLFCRCRFSVHSQYLAMCWRTFSALSVCSTG